MAAFPINLGCINTQNYSEVLPSSKMYLGGGVLVKKATAVVSFSMDTHLDMKNFTDWYISTIAYGTLPFTIDAPFFGVRRDWNVGFSNDLVTKLLGKISLGREIKLDLVILDDVGLYVS